VIGGGFGVTSLPNIAVCRRMGVSLEALLWAFAGGSVACYFASRRDRGGDSGTAQPPAALQSGLQGD
jgi:hypothetical protein